MGASVTHSEGTHHCAPRIEEGRAQHSRIQKHSPFQRVADAYTCQSVYCIHGAVASAQGNEKCNLFCGLCVRFLAEQVRPFLGPVVTLCLSQERVDSVHPSKKWRKLFRMVALEVGGRSTSCMQPRAMFLIHCGAPFSRFPGSANNLYAAIFASSEIDCFLSRHHCRGGAVCAV